MSYMYNSWSRMFGVACIKLYLSLKGVGREWLVVDVMITEMLQ